MPYKNASAPSVRADFFGPMLPVICTFYCKWWRWLLGPAPAGWPDGPLADERDGEVLGRNHKSEFACGCGRHLQRLGSWLGMRGPHFFLGRPSFSSTSASAVMALGFKSGCCQPRQVATLDFFLKGSRCSRELPCRLQQCRRATWRLLSKVFLLLMCCPSRHQVARLAFLLKRGPPGHQVPSSARSERRV